MLLSEQIGVPELSAGLQESLRDLADLVANDPETATVDQNPRGCSSAPQCPRPPLLRAREPAMTTVALATLMGIFGLVGITFSMRSAQ